MLASVETVNRGRQGDRIRLWYNKLDRRNLRPAVVLAVEERTSASARPPLPLVETCRGRLPDAAARSPGDSPGALL